MNFNKETISKLAKKDVRLDMRSLTDFREPINISTDISWTAEGSAQVQVGKTKVMAGVKLSIEKPYNDTPDQGGIMINAELTPLSNPEYESGPPSIKAVELARVVDRGIREAKAIDLKKLCIEPGEKAWFVSIDIITINDDGNLFDVASLAAVTALKAAVFPEVDKNNGSINYKKKTTTPLPLKKEPLAVTVYKINSKLMVDPTWEEEKAYDARLTVASDGDGTISAMQKGGSAPLTVDEISKMVEISLEKASFLRKKLHSALSK